MQLHLVTLLSTVSVVLAGGRFKESCKDIRYRNDVEALSANCGTGSGGYHYTEVALNWILTNRNGVLSWAPNGNAMHSCHMVNYFNGDSLVEIWCAGGGGWAGGYVNRCDLNAHIFNNWGNFGYDSYVGDDSCYVVEFRTAPGNETKIGGNETELVDATSLKDLPTVTTFITKEAPVTSAEAIQTVPAEKV